MVCNSSNCAHSARLCGCTNNHRNCPRCPLNGKNTHGTRPPVGTFPNVLIPTPTPAIIFAAAGGAAVVGIPAHHRVIAGPGLIPLNCGRCGGNGHSSGDHCENCDRIGRHICCTFCQNAGHDNRNHQCNNCRGFGHRARDCVSGGHGHVNVIGPFVATIDRFGRPIMIIPTGGGGNGGGFGGHSAGIGTWSCPFCGLGNAGHYCTNPACGRRRPF